MRVVAILIIVILTTSAVALTLRSSAVTKARVDRFARRHRLSVTAANQDQVIAYLRTTRRWRLAGVVGGIALPAFFTTSAEQGLTIGFLPVLVGWFVGALAAEARVSHLAHGERRAASLAPRSAERYVPPTVRALVPVTTGLCIATAVATVIAALAGREIPPTAAAVPLAFAMGVAAAVWMVWHSVLLHRPQPPTDPDVLAADDAIRSRSLHVLGVAGAVLIFACITFQLDALLGPGQWGPALGVVLLVVAFLGWIAATGVWQVPRPTAPPARVGAARPMDP